ncbi:MAG: bifunctional adenosylcobinamide kinase/adenosylcobinamide-phosphate guanylyltransferase [Bryobacteraceae bacterium]|jgi:adenosylcobinamide kinase/adenosylcobinamide-phosphate guanylyltransferase
MLTLILGGARSGKSRLARERAAGSGHIFHSQVSHGKVCYIATARAGDDAEIDARIARHQGDRPAEWQTVEAPLRLAEAVEQASQQSAVVLVDCLTIWLSNFMFEHRQAPAGETEAAALAEIDRIANAARSGGRQVILVSNEVGSATVPESPVARAFRDLQGTLNQHAARHADEVLLAVAGLPVKLK